MYSPRASPWLKTAKSHLGPLGPWSSMTWGVKVLCWARFTAPGGTLLGERGNGALGTCLARRCAPGRAGRRTDRQTAWHPDIHMAAAAGWFGSLQQISPLCMSKNTITEEGPAWTVQGHGRAHHLTPAESSERDWRRNCAWGYLLLEDSVTSEVRLDSQHNVMVQLTKNSRECPYFPLIHTNKISNSGRKIP